MAAISGTALTLTKAITTDFSSATMTFTATNGAVTFEGPTLTLSNPTSAAVSSITATFRASSGVLHFLAFAQLGTTSVNKGLSVVQLGSAANAAGVLAGQSVSGVGISLGSRVQRVEGGSDVVLSQPVTASLSNSFLYFNEDPSNTYKLALASAANVKVGQQVAGAGITPGTTVRIGLGQN